MKDREKDSEEGSAEYLSGVITRLIRIRHLPRGERAQSTSKNLGALARALARGHCRK